MEQKRTLLTGQVVWARADNEPPWPAVIKQIKDVRCRVAFIAQKTTAWITYNNVFNYEKFKGVFNNDSTNPKLKKAVQDAQRLIFEKTAKQQKIKNRILKQPPLKNSSEQEVLPPAPSKQKILREGNTRPHKQSLRRLPQNPPENFKKFEDFLQILQQPIKSDYSSLRQLRILVDKCMMHIFACRINRQENLDDSVREHVDKILSTLSTTYIKPAEMLATRTCHSINFICQLLEQDPTYDDIIEMIRHRMNKLQETLNNDFKSIGLYSQFIRKLRPKRTVEGQADRTE